MRASNNQTELTAEIRRAAGLADACAQVREIYARLQNEIDQRKPLCIASGKCCHFETYGHRLYVTTLELATFAVDLRNNRPAIVSDGLPILADGCPLQQNKLCSVHAIRPFGCRIFFCDPTATLWQQEQYERFHQELKQLHQRFEIGYFYIEWRQGLRAIENLPDHPITN